MHRILLAERDGVKAPKSPGDFRRSQNWIGRPGGMLKDATFVSPSSRGDEHWERYPHSEASEASAGEVRHIALSRGSYHPFLDGNGRVWRLLITLFLCPAVFVSTTSLPVCFF
jgi:fido (protein-threonine AMPylation protein)